jgi:hypothetical protein
MNRSITPKPGRADLPVRPIFRHARIARDETLRRSPRQKRRCATMTYVFCQAIPAYSTTPRGWKNSSQFPDPSPAESATSAPPGAPANQAQSNLFSPRKLFYATLGPYHIPETQNAIAQAATRPQLINSQLPNSKTAQPFAQQLRLTEPACITYFPRLAGRRNQRLAPTFFSD